MSDKFDMWVVIVYGEYETSRTYGLFSSQEQATTWAETLTGIDSYEVRRVRNHKERGMV